MQYVSQLMKSVGSAFDINPSTFSGATDIVVCEREDGTLHSTPFYVRFGKLEILKQRDKIVDIYVNYNKIPDVKMKISSTGEVFFAVEVDIEEEKEQIPDEILTSPILEPEEPSEYPDMLKLGEDTSTTSEPMEVVVETDSIEDDYPFSDSEVEILSRIQTREMIRNQMFAEGRFKNDLNASVEAGKRRYHYHERSRTREFPGEGRKDSVETKESAGKGWRFLGLFRRERKDENGEDEEEETEFKSPEMGFRDEDFIQFKPQDFEYSFNPALLVENEEDMETLTDLLTCKSSPSIVSSADSELAMRDDAFSIENDIHISLCKKELVELGVGLGKSHEQMQKQNNEMDELTWRKAMGVFFANIVSFAQFSENPQVLNDGDLVYLIGNLFLDPSIAVPKIISMSIFKKDLETETLKRISKREYKKRKNWTSWIWRRGDGGIESTSTASKESIEELNDERGVGKKEKDESETGLKGKHKGKKWKKSFIPTSEQLSKLNLKLGANEISFRIRSRFQGEKVVNSLAYLWKSTDKVIVSDVDGTITKSDVLGHILTVLGRDWSHAGVVSLYSDIAELGYRFLYLTTRPVGQARHTRVYLHQLKHGAVALPLGPVFLSPERLFDTIRREVLTKNPEEVKIRILRGISRIFPKDSNPFYAGFGNRRKDALSYESSGIPRSKIFITNSKGVVFSFSGKIGTYEDLKELVEHIFPDITIDDEVKGKIGGTPPDYSSFRIWKDPLPPVDLDI